ncbi:MAG: rhodanese-like domain-containing protein [Pirellulales bacterium]
MAAAIAAFGAFRCQWLLVIVAKATFLKQVAFLCGASLLAALAGNLVFGDPLHHGKGVAAATASSEQAKYRIGTLDDARKATVSGGTLLVDARRERDYRLGTIDGAVNIPVTASVWEINKYLERIKRSTPIVVFCQSASCGYDETVARELVSLGFDDVTVCDEGWREYENSKHHADAN